MPRKTKDKGTETPSDYEIHNLNEQDYENTLNEVDKLKRQVDDIKSLRVEREKALDELQKSMEVYEHLYAKKMSEIVAVDEKLDKVSGGQRREFDKYERRLHRQIETQKDIKSETEKLEQCLYIRTCLGILVITILIWVIIWRWGAFTLFTD